MSKRLGMESAWLRSRVEEGDPFWPAQLAVAVAIGLNFALADKVTLGPIWLMPAIEGALLAALVAIAGPSGRAKEHAPRRRAFALTVIAIVSAANIASLAMLVDFLINGGEVGGHRLIQSGAVLWATNVLLFAVWYWEMDGGGPVHRFQRTHALLDFQFPQSAPAGRWRPGFGDYLYTSLTNATAFSPTDTMPLTHTAKLVMALQSVTALLTVGLVVARAVNILG
jgi:uncharacterized membrane protein